MPGSNDGLRGDAEGAALRALMSALIEDGSPRRALAVHAHYVYELHEVANSVHLYARRMHAMLALRDVGVAQAHGES